MILVGVERSDATAPLASGHTSPLIPALQINRSNHMTVHARLSHVQRCSRCMCIPSVYTVLWYCLGLTSNHCRGGTRPRNLAPTIIRIDAGYDSNESCQLKNQLQRGDPKPSKNGLFRREALIFTAAGRSGPPTATPRAPIRNALGASMTNCLTRAILVCEHEL